MSGHKTRTRSRRTTSESRLSVGNSVLIATKIRLRQPVCSFTRRNRLTPTTFSSNYDYLYIKRAGSSRAGAFVFTVSPFRFRDNVSFRFHSTFVLISDDKFKDRLTISRINIYFRSNDLTVDNSHHHGRSH